MLQNREILPPENPAALRVFAEAALGTSEFELTPHASQGYVSRTYTCDGPSDSYILRHSFNQRGLAKDAYAAQHFGRDDLPIPAVVSMGQVDDASVACLSERAPGALPDETELSTPGTALNTELAATLRAIHTTGITDSRGYGFGRANGRGLLPRMLFAAGVQRVALERIAHRFAARQTALERGTFRDIAALQRSLGGFCIAERALCHGDPKGANLLAENDRITGVIDWDRFEYNDPALDLGILHVRHPGAVDPYAHAQTVGLNERGLRERVLYYAMTECSVAIAFFGRIGNEAELLNNERRLVQIANEAATR